jgi:APA family basic amino acid/polyamine antiporter
LEWYEAQGCVFCFIGFDAVSTAAEANPQKRNANWYFRFISICTILYVLFAYVLTGLENYLNFKGDASPVTTALQKQVTFYSDLHCNYCRIHF